MRPRPRLLILNAALAGDTGNTAVVLADLRRRLARSATVETLTLADALPHDSARELPAPVLAALAKADGFVIGTGTHWDGWSSVLQRFLEQATATEGTKTWLGKPAAVVVTEHSVGGKGVLSRLQGVLVTLGCTLPPMSGLVISRAALLAAEAKPAAAQDFWSPADLGIVAHNLLTAARHDPHPRWRAWPVDRNDFHGRWLGI